MSATDDPELRLDAFRLQVAALQSAARGDTRGSRSLVAQAMRTLPGDVPTEIASLAQLAEAELAEERPREASALLADALEKADSIGSSDEVRVALARRRAVCLIALEDFDAVEALFTSAAALSSPRNVAFLRTEQARLLLDAGAPERARAVLPPLESHAAQDLQLRAEILVERSRLHRAGGRDAAAESDAADARESALEAVAPVPYFAASVALAELAGDRGDRLAAYASLAKAWATLAALLGREVARSWVEPCLAAHRLRWGDEAFATARHAYESQRRQACESQRRPSGVWGAP